MLSTLNYTLLKSIIRPIFIATNQAKSNSNLRVRVSKGFQGFFLGMINFSKLVNSLIKFLIPSVLRTFIFQKPPNSFNSFMFSLSFLLAVHMLSLVLLIYVVLRFQ